MVFVFAALCVLIAPALSLPADLKSPEQSGDKPYEDMPDVHENDVIPEKTENKNNPESAESSESTIETLPDASKNQPTGVVYSVSEKTVNGLTSGNVSRSPAIDEKCKFHNVFETTIFSNYKFNNSQNRAYFFI